MHRALLVAGPPHTAALWADVAARLGSVCDVETCALLTDPAFAPTVEGQADLLVEALGGGAGRTVLVAHGLACPAAIEAAIRAKGAALVLCNGPITHLDPVTLALARLARVPAILPDLLFRPGLAVRWLYSSLGLRRAVRNPYVMDRDTVVAICAPLFQSRTTRDAMARYLRDLPGALRSTARFDGPTTLLWGDEDALYPPWLVDEARGRLPRLTHVAVPGGRALHPVERPWLVADAIADAMTDLFADAAPRVDPARAV